MYVNTFATALAVIVGECRIRFVLSSNCASNSSLVRSVPMAIISATSLGFSAQICHIRLTALSSAFSKHRSRSNSRWLIIHSLPSCNGYIASFCLEPSNASMSNVSHFSVSIANARCSVALFVFFAIVLGFSTHHRSRSYLQVLSSQVG